jgi:hypothetical protein
MIFLLICYYIIVFNSLKMLTSCIYLLLQVQELERSPSQQQTETKAADQASAHRVQLLEAEVQQQEQLIVATQKENEKLCMQLKELKVGTLPKINNCNGA